MNKCGRARSDTTSMRRYSGYLLSIAAYQVPTNQFIMFDDHMVNVETVSAELTITQPREIFLYAKTFQELSKVAIYGRGAKELIAARLTGLRDR